MKSFRFICAAAAFLAALVFTSARAATADYAKKLTMTVNPASVAYASSDVADVPVAVRLSESISGFSYSDFQVENGGDLLFTDEGGNVLPHEIEKWNTSGESIVWVRVPKFGAGRRFNAYYGGEAVAQNATGVWSGYAGVWHMSEDSGTVADATGNGLDAEPKGGDTTQSVATSGPVGNGRVNASNGTSNRLETPYSSALDLYPAQTFSGWVKMSQLNANYTMAIAMHKESTWDTGWAVKVMANSSNEVFFWGNSNANCEQLGAQGIPDMLDDWVHIATTWNNYTGYIYINGQRWQQVRSGDYTSNSWQSPPGNNTKPLAFGYTSNGNNEVGPHLTDAFQGAFDEFRLSGGAKSAEQIAAEYAAQMPNALTYSVSDPGDEGFAAVELTNFRKSFTIAAANYEGSETFADYPMLVRLSTAIDGFSYDDFIRGDHADLAFFDASGNALAFDVDTWNAAGESLVWVKVPSFAADTTITCAYGGVVKSDIHNPATWSGYRGVWHLNETGEGSTAIFDATANDMNGTSHTATAPVSAGQFGGSRRMATRRGPSDQNGGVRIPFNAAMNNNVSGRFSMVASMWVNLDSGGNWGGALFMRKNAMDDGGWGFAYHYTEMNHFDYYFRESYDGIYTPHSDGGGGYTQYNAAESIWKTTIATSEWHKYTVVYDWNGSYIVCKQFLDGVKGSDCWLYNFTDDGNGNSTGERSYAPLCQPTDKGLALGAFIGSGQYPLLGAMDEARLRFGSTSETRESLDFAQESNSAYYTYSTVADIENSTAPTVTTLSETIAGELNAEQTTMTVRGSVAKLVGDSATVWLLVGKAGEGFSAADNLARVASKTVNAAGEVTFDFATTFGAENAYALVVDNVLDATHSIQSQTDVGSVILPGNVEYVWKSAVAEGNWEDPANWTCTANDGIARIGYPSYGSRFRLNGGTTATIKLHAYYGGTSYGQIDAAYFDNANIEATFIAETEGAGFKVGNFRTDASAPVKLTFDGMTLVGGTWTIYANSELNLINGTSLNLAWQMNVNGANASLYVGGGSYLATSTAEVYHWLDVSGDGACATIDDSTVLTRHLYFGRMSSSGTPAGIVVKGANPVIRVQGEARVYSDIPGSPAITFVLPETGFASTPILKAGSGSQKFMDSDNNGYSKVNIVVDRDSPFYVQRRATLEQTFVDWRYNGSSFSIDADGLALKKPRGGTWSLGESVLSAAFDVKPSFIITVR